MPAADFVAMVSRDTVLGDPLLKTQHFVGATTWRRVAADEVVAWHQLRVPHQRYRDVVGGGGAGAGEGLRREVVVKGHAHSTNKHWYRRVGGEWKLAGLAPDIRWFEYDFDKVFESGREELGEAREGDDS